MTGKTIPERIQEAEVRIRQLEVRRQALARQLRQQERKQRTRRLSQIGAIMDSLGINTLDKAQVLQRTVKGCPEAQDWLSQVCGGSSGPSET